MLWPPRSRRLASRAGCRAAHAFGVLGCRVGPLWRALRAREAYSFSSALAAWAALITSSAMRPEIGL